MFDIGHGGHAHMNSRCQDPLVKLDIRAPPREILRSRWANLPRTTTYSSLAVIQRVLELETPI